MSNSNLTYLFEFVMKSVPTSDETEDLSHGPDEESASYTVTVYVGES